MDVLIRHLLLVPCLLAAPLLWAGDRASADAATAEVLFDLDIENASYKVRHDGYVDILFGPSLSEDRYQHALQSLKAHPDIPGVLAGRGSADYCPP